MVKNENGVITRYTESEKEMREDFFRLFKDSPIPNEEILRNLGLYIRRQELKRHLFMNELYKKIIDVNGIIVEFGTRWGQNLALFESFRGIYDPFNLYRKIVGFDTFEGFPSVTEKDGGFVSKNDYSVSKNYEEYLEQVLIYHEQESPVGHLKKFEIIKGDVVVEVEKYFLEHPETIVALAYFDLDLYSPTKKCLETIKSHLTKGSVLGFDELNDPNHPGETLALKEIFGLDKYEIKRNCYSVRQSYIVID